MADGSFVRRKRTAANGHTRDFRQGLRRDRLLNVKCTSIKEVTKGMVVKERTQLLHCNHGRHVTPDPVN
jgi:trehalose-6-phosphatase